MSFLPLQLLRVGGDIPGQPWGSLGSGLRLQSCSGQKAMSPVCRLDPHLRNLAGRTCIGSQAAGRKLLSLPLLPSVPPKPTPQSLTLTALGPLYLLWGSLCKDGLGAPGSSWSPGKDFSFSCKGGKVSPQSESPHPNTGDMEGYRNQAPCCKEWPSRSWAQV